MPNLTEEDATLTVDGVDDGFPRLDLLLRLDARRLWVTLGGGGPIRGLRDEQATTGGTLRGVHHGVWLRHLAVGAAPRQRREHNTVRELEMAHLVGHQQRDRLFCRLTHHLCVYLDASQLKFS